MKERPITFSSRLMPLVLDGSKVMTRRVIRPVRAAMGPLCKVYAAKDWAVLREPAGNWVACTTATMLDDGPRPTHDALRLQANLARLQAYVDKNCRGCGFPCPQGVRGDQLWVREAWATEPACDTLRPSAITPGGRRLWYLASGVMRLTSGEYTDAAFLAHGRYRHARFMPRWASRASLLITAVRAEPLQEITWQDIRSEGIGCPEHDFESGFCSSECPSLRAEFARGWDALHEHKPGELYADGPCVFVITFELLPLKEGAAPCSS